MLWIPLVLAVLVVGRAKGQKKLNKDYGTFFKEQKPFLHIRAKDGAVSLVLRGIYLHDGVLWLCMEGRNRSRFDFRVDWLTLTIRGRKRPRRTAIQEISVQPLFVQQPLLIPGDSAVSMVYGIVPRVLGKDKEMAIELRERNGDRRVRLVVNRKDLFRARP
jgi:hypothetical protein